MAAPQYNETTSKNDSMSYLQYYLSNPQANPYTNNALVSNESNPALLGTNVPLGRTFYEQRLHSPVQIDDVQYNHSFVQPASIAKSEHELACNLNSIANEALEEKVTNVSGAKLEHANKVKLANAKKGTAICATKKPDFEQSYIQFLTETESCNLKRRKINSFNVCTEPITVLELTAANISLIQKCNQILNVTKCLTTALSVIHDLSYLSKSINSTSQVKEEEIGNKIVVEHKQNPSIEKNATSKNVDEAGVVNLQNYIDIIDEINVEKARADELIYKEFEIMDNAESNENRSITKVSSYCDYIEKLKNENRVKEVPPTNSVLDTNIQAVKLGVNNFTNNNFPNNKSIDDFVISLDFLDKTMDGFDKSFQAQLAVTDDSIANVSTSSGSNPLSKQNCNLFTWITKQGSNKDLDIETCLAIEEYNFYINL